MVQDLYTEPRKNEKHSCFSFFLTPTFAARTSDSAADELIHRVLRYK